MFRHVNKCLGCLNSLCALEMLRLSLSYPQFIFMVIIALFIAPSLQIDLLLSWSNPCHPFISFREQRLTEAIELDGRKRGSFQFKDQIKDGLIGNWHIRDLILANNSAMIQCVLIIEIGARENKSLLLSRDALFVLNLPLEWEDSVWGRDIQGNGVSFQGLNLNVHLFV